MKQELQINQFCYSYPKETNTYSQIYIAEPDKKFLEKFGQLNILINLNFKIETKKQILSWAKDWSQELIDVIKNYFYNPLRTTINLEKDFEESLQKINNWVQQEKMVNQETFEDFLTNLDIDIILIKDEKIYFSQMGEIETRLLKDDRLIDLLETKNKSQKFLNIVSGDLENDSILLFTNKEIFNYFSEQKIIQILQVNSLEKIGLEFKKILTQEDNLINFFGLFVSIKNDHGANEIEKGAVDLKVKEKPINRMNPEKISEPIKQEIESISPKPKKIIEKKIIEKPKKIKRMIDLPIIKTSRLAYFRKYLFIVIIILALIFIQSIVILARQQIKAKQAQEYAEMVENMKNKENDLSTALIYQDSLKIKTSATEFQKILNQLPLKTEEQQEIFKNFQKGYIEQMNKFYRLVSIDEPKILIDFIETDENFKPGGFTNIGNDFYIFNPANNYIYLFNVETKKLELVNKISTNIGRLERISFWDNDNLIGIDQNQGLINFNAIDKKLLSLKFNRKELPKITDLAIYNRRLYTLEPLNNQIYKHDKTIDGFGQEQKWINDQTDISAADCFTIDGSVYILNKTGKISKFYQGNKADFPMEEIYPVLSYQDPNILKPEGKTKIYTNSDLNYLYVLDGPTKRLIILNKNGDLIKQFTSPEFKDLKDFIVNKKENLAWLLAGTKIFEIEIK